MPKRPGSPLESQTTRKPSRFFPETILPEASALPVTDVKDGQPGQDLAGPNVKPPEMIDDGMSKTQLADLLSLEGLSSHEEIEAHFHLIARELLSNYRIRIRQGINDTNQDSTEADERVPDVELQLMEMEFYLISPNVHEDPYCHGSLEQAQSGCWYFHRAPRYTTSSTHMPSVGGGFRGGSRKGLDLTIGSAVQSTPTDGVPPYVKPRGGILFRSARVVSTGVVVSGPSLLVDFILSACGVDAIETLVFEMWKGDTSALETSSRNKSAPQLSIVPIASPVHDSGVPIPYYTTPRIGLDLSHTTSSAAATNPRVIFVKRPYRFLVDPQLLKSNGRPQTFVGLLPHAMETLKISRPLGLGERDRLLKHMVSLGGFTASGARSYMQYYEAGLKGGSNMLGSFCGTRGKGVCQSPEKLLQMFGALKQFESD